MDPSVIHNTFVVERSFAKPPERVFQAFADPAQKRRWFGEGDQHELLDYALDFRVGGVETMRYRFGASTPFPGVELGNELRYLDIVADRRLVAAQSMEFAGKRISATLVTIEFLRASAGTDLICTHQGAFFEGSDGPQLREQGWRTLFERLAQELG